MKLLSYLIVVLSFVLGTLETPQYTSTINPTGGVQGNMINEVSLYYIIRDLTAKTYMVLYYQPNCKFSKAFFETWNNYVEAHGYINAYKYNCHERNGNVIDTLCKTEGITGYPTVKLYRRGKDRQVTATPDYNQFEKNVQSGINLLRMSTIFTSTNEKFNNVFGNNSPTQAS
ncbi:hypothetical protein IWQ62_003978 [Dispira parvispora]|uniref:Thioredoxin domain-containing protein n=1 Tax=Dispira parvispora TaxID=1520584 RepID=A0A9W8ATU2_9FUNG|nr:hypothetical protein IWQ62_003978 [Dispira parvispora]